MEATALATRGQEATDVEEFSASAELGRAPAAARRIHAAAKRAIDVVVATSLLLCTAPISLLVAILIKIVDRGPVLFWQVRIGRDGREFWFPKFRSMRVGAHLLHRQMLPHNDHRHGPTFKMKQDPRVTRLGRAIRTLSLDELPQLWSVLAGDMSLVGPRPPLPHEVAQYTPTQKRRLEVKPGLTCLWQVSGRSTLAFADQVALDIEYIDKQSLWLDLKLLLLTVPAVLTCRGAW